MKKQELIHMHGLLCEVQNYVQETQNTPTTIPEYANINVTPTSIQKKKRAHKLAVFTLAEGLANTDIASSPPVKNQVSATAD